MTTKKTKKATKATKATKTTKAAQVQSPIRVGNSVLIRTVTHYLTGRVVGVTDLEILLADAAWIAETDRWATTLRTGALREVEPHPDGYVVSVGRGSIVDVCDWRRALPREQR